MKEEILYNAKISFNFFSIIIVILYSIYIAYKFSKKLKLSKNDILVIIILYLIPFIFNIKGLSYHKSDINNIKALASLKLTLKNINDNYHFHSKKYPINSNIYIGFYKYLYQKDKDINSYEELLLNINEYHFYRNYDTSMINKALRAKHQVLAKVKQFNNIYDTYILITNINEKNLYRIYYPKSSYLSSLEYDESILNNIESYIVVIR